jgi:hypothetical protein
VFNKFFIFYENFFGLSEFKDSRSLQGLFWISLLGFYVSLYQFSYKGYGGLAQNTCWPYFQNCNTFKFFSAYPYSYSLTGFYAVLYSVMIMSGYFFLRQAWLKAHFLLFLLFLWKTILFFFLSYDIAANFEFFHLGFCAILLFARQKIYFSQRFFVVLYFLSALVKLHDSWISGSYFSSLQLGLPFVPDFVIPFLTNFVIILETFLCWFLLSRNSQVQRIVFYLFVAFHLYSIVLVGYNYPTYTLLPVIFLFGVEAPLFLQNQSDKLSAGTLIIATLCLFHLPPYLISGERPYTQEGYKFGVAMFDSNHQCRSTTKISYVNQPEISKITDSNLANNRCSAYTIWFGLKKFCKDPKITKISWTFDHSINGGPFYRIVDLENMCTSQYSAWKKNEWLKSPNENSTVIGYPEKNYMWGELPVKNSNLIYDVPQYERGFQPKGKVVEIFIKFWQTIWCCIGLYALLNFFKPFFRFR